MRFPTFTGFRPMLSLAVLAGLTATILTAEPATGRVEIETYESTLATQPRRQLAIYLPPGHNPATSAPVLYLLHGAGGHARTWIDKAALPAAMDRLINDGIIRPLVVVMPHGDLIQPPSKENTGENADLLIQELETVIMPMMEKKYGVSTKRAETGIAGNSKGARQAVYIALRRPDRFGAVGAFSVGRYPPLTPDGEEGRLARDITSRKLTFSPLLIGCGSNEPTYRETGRICVDLFSFQKTALTVSSAGNGGHEWAVWTDLLENHFLPAWLPAKTTL